MTRTYFGRNFVTLREREGLTQIEMAEKLGRTQTTISAWETRGKEPKNKTDFIAQVGRLFGASETDLYGANDGLYAKLHGLTEAPAGSIAPKEPRRAYAPLYGRVHAGDTTEPDVLEDSIPIPYDVLDHHRGGYFLEVEGSCMDRVYPPGCYIFIDPDMPPRDGSIAVVERVELHETVMRRMRHGSSALYLIPESNDEQWEDIVITDEPIRLIGTVVWFQSSEEMV